MIRFTMTVAAALVVTAFSTQADARSFSDMLKECGLGAMLFPDDPGLAMFFNLTSDGSMSTTSGLTTPGACMGGKETTAMIIYKSYEEIEVELASGSGPYLSLLSSVTKNENQSEKEFVLRIRNEFGQYVSSPDFSSHDRMKKAERLYHIVMN
jgi:hypothetical protein